MNTRTDQQLLRDYAGSRSEAAFAELVRRHVDLVYSAALRMLCDSHLAEDVTQSVFVALAQNARQLTHHPVLSGWLHRTTQNLAANAVRTNVRRQTREQEAAAMNELLSDRGSGAVGPPAWYEIAPHLDAALGELSESDRDAVLLRYFEKKSAREMASYLGISDDAAQKRVSRAVERLREFFAKRGVTAGASGLAVVISANAVQAAPTGLVLTISTTAALTGTTLATTATVTATKAIAMTALQKTIVTATIAVLAGAGIYEARQASQLREQVRTLQQQQAPLVEQVQQLQSEREKDAERIASFQSDVERLNQNSAEMLRLRNQLNLLRRDAAQTNSQIAIEPTYENRSLSEWLADLDTPFPTNGRREDDPKYAKAAAAIRAMGSHAFPYLLKLLSGGGGDAQMRQAVRAFEALGPQAGDLIPQFENLFEKSPGYSLHAMAYIGKDSTPILVKSLEHENVWVRNNAASALTQNLYDERITPQEAAEALPFAFRNLNYSSADTNHPQHTDNVRWRAAELIGAIGLQPEDSIPALVKTMNDSGDSLTVKCAEVLMKFKAGNQAIPALTRVTTSSTNEILRRMAFDALERIKKAQ